MRTRAGRGETQPAAGRPGPGWRRTGVAVLAAVGVVSAALYTTTAAAPTVHVATVAQVRAAQQVDTQGLIAQAQQLAATGNAGDVARQVGDLLRRYGIDPAGVQSLLDQVTAAASPQQVLADTHTFLVAAGVKPADLGALQSQLQQLQQQQVSPGLLAAIVATLAGMIAGYWWIFPIIVAAVVVAIVFVAFTGGQQRADWKNGPGCGADAATMEGYRVKLPVRPVGAGPTTGTAFDTPTYPTVTLTVQSGGRPSGSYRTPEENATGWNLAAEALKILPQVGNLDHVETKVATYMRLQGDSSTTSRGQTATVDQMCLVINNDAGPCDLNPPSPQATGCLVNVPRLMSRQRGQSLTVNWKLGTSWFHVDLHN